MNFKDILSKLRIFFEMIKFEHSIFALPFAYLGLMIAENGWPSFSLFAWVTLAMVSFRTMGMAWNRLADLEIDAVNPRTANRALPKRKLSRLFVWALIIISFAIFEWSAYRLNSLCFALSAIPVFLTLIYPFAKRFTWMSHFILGLILGIAPYGAWLASRPEFSWVPGLITLGVMAWVAAFDVIYALQDEKFDREFGLYSLPARFGKDKSLVLARALHAFTVVAWWLAGYFAGLGAIYFLGLGFVILFLIREHWLVRTASLGKVNEAFFTMNALISLSVFVAVAADLTWKGWMS